MSLKTYAVSFPRDFCIINEECFNCDTKQRLRCLKNDPYYLILVPICKCHLESYNRLHEWKHKENYTLEKQYYIMIINFE